MNTAKPLKPPLDCHSAHFGKQGEDEEQQGQKGHDSDADALDRAEEELPQQSAEIMLAVMAKDKEEMLVKQREATSNLPGRRLEQPLVRWLRPEERELGIDISWAKALVWLMLVV